MADNTSQIAGLFMTPEMYQQTQNENAFTRAALLAKMDPLEAAKTSIGYAGYQAGNALAGALGAQDPMLAQLSQQKQMLSNVDFTNAQSLAEAARQATAAGRPDIAQQLAQQAITIQSKIDERQAAREQALQIAREKIEATIEAARIRGEDQKTIARMQIEGRKEIAQLAASLKGEKPLTEFQGKSMTFGTRAAEANNILNNLEGTYNRLSANTLPSWLNSTEGQQAQQAQNNFVNAVLRQESGAAINSSEFANAKKQYFPQVGDSQEVIDQKRRNRELVIQGFARQAGPAGGDVMNVFNNPPPKAVKTTFKSVAEAEKANLPKGTIITINGKQAIVE